MRPHFVSPWNLILILSWLAVAPGCTPDYAPISATAENDLLRSGASIEVAPAPEVTVPVGAHWPDPDWTVASPETRGIDPSRLADLVAAAPEQAPGLLSILVLRGGDLVLEHYFSPAGPETRREVYSVTKSFSATLVGIAIDRGNISGVGERVLDFFPNQPVSNPGPEKASMMLEDLLTMTSGLDWTEDDSSIQALYTRPDWVQHMLDLPIVDPPGQTFNYCTGCSHLLTAIVEQATQMSAMEFASQAIFAPLGFGKVEWQVDAQGIPIGGWGLQLTPREMARLGYLYLRGGRWKDQQIISSQWVQAATTAQVAAEPGYEYGYQWWVRPSIAGYAAIGRGGQMVAVIPEKDLVVVFTSTTGDSDTLFGLIEDFVLPSLNNERGHYRKGIFTSD